MQNDQKKIVVMGLGYIGLPTASMLATKGHQVLGVDVNEAIITTINSGDIHIAEPGLDILVSSAVNSGRLKASLLPDYADIFILTVPTPFHYSGIHEKKPDISFIEAATRSIADYIRPGNLVILESTSPVGTTEHVRDIIAEARPELFPAAPPPESHSQVYIAHCPERVLPGSIIRELVENDRIIGGVDKEASLMAKKLYKTFCQGKIYLTDSRTAEMAKLVENSFRDVNLAFANELSVICDRLGINVWELIELANRHPRVNILNPGPGVGGHCIAVDPWFIVSAAPEEARLIKTAREVNDAKPQWVLEKIREKAALFKMPVIGCLGLAFKANIDDLRESPALEITRSLISSGVGRVMACEPNIARDFNEFALFSLEQVLNEADILVMLVDHDEFREIDKKVLMGKVVIDTRGVWR